MKKKFVLYKKGGEWRKAVLDESLFNYLTTDKSITEVVEYESEMMLEKRFAEKLGRVDNRKTLLD